MAGTKRRPSISVLDGRARLIRPTANRKTWQVTYTDPVTGKFRSTSGGHSQDEAEDKARAILGEWVPDYLQRGAQPPTLREAFESWVNENQSRWNSRTIDNYTYCGKRFLTTLGERPITTISPKDISKIDLSHLSRGQQKRTRSLIRGTFTHAQKWLRYDPEEIARAVKITGSKSAAQSEQVTRGDIPTTDYVNSVITCAYSTLQEPLTRRNGTVVTPAPFAFSKGLPQEISEAQRRGIPKHYRHLEEREAQETQELSSRFRQYGLIVALGAGGGLRIGEILALRVRHFLTEDQLNFNLLSFDSELPDDAPLFMNYMGRVEVSEQASQASKGKLWLTAPKGGKERTVWLPAVLPAGSGHDFMDHGDTLRNRASKYIDRFNDPSISLWTLTRGEALTLWSVDVPPLAFFLWQRLTELWNSDPIQSIDNPIKQKAEFRKLLLFPTRNRIRGNKKLPSIEFEPNWAHDAGIVEGTGTYQNATNLATRYMNPIYDYVSEQLGGYYPAHRINKTTGRKGWTHHGLRHYAISSWLASPLVSLPQVSEQAGHKDTSFTLKRYGHLFGGQKIERAGWEF